MSVTVPLRQSVPVTLDASGGGTARLGPVSLRETWYPQVASVGTNQGPGDPVVSEAQCKVYQGEDATQPNFCDGTLSGSTGDSTSNVSGPLYCGQYVWAVWTGGDAGAQACLTVTGSRQIA